VVTVGETAPRVNVAVPACIQKPGVKVASVVAAVASAVAEAEGAKTISEIDPMNTKIKSQTERKI
jgi:hypothetical protein